MSGTEKLAEVLAIHDDWWYSMDDGAYLCRGCQATIGERSPGRGSKLLAAHQADVVLAHLTAEGWARGADAWDAGWQDAHADHNDNPYVRIKA